jgi:hypothetical protein
MTKAAKVKKRSNHVMTVKCIVCASDIPVGYFSTNTLPHPRSREDIYLQLEARRIGVNVMWSLLEVDLLDLL